MFCLLFIGMRVAGRVKPLGGAGFGIDDFVLFASCIPMLGLTITGWIGLQGGMGLDVWELSIQQIEYCLKVRSVSQVSSN